MEGSLQTTRRFKQSIVFQTEPEVVYEWMEIQPQKVGSELTHIIIIKVNGKTLMHKAGSKLWFAHHLLVEILLLHIFSLNATDLQTGIKV